MACAWCWWLRIYVKRSSRKSVALQYLLDNYMHTLHAPTCVGEREFLEAWPCVFQLGVLMRGTSSRYWRTRHFRGAGKVSLIPSFFKRSKEPMGFQLGWCMTQQNLCSCLEPHGFKFHIISLLDPWASPLIPATPRMVSDSKLSLLSFALNKRLCWINKCNNCLAINGH